MVFSALVGRCEISHVSVAPYKTLTNENQCNVLAKIR